MSLENCIKKYGRESFIKMFSMPLEMIFENDIVELPKLSFYDDEYDKQTYGVSGTVYHYIACNGKDIYWVRTDLGTISDFVMYLSNKLGIDLNYIYEYQIKNANKSIEKSYSYCAASNTHDNLAKYDNVFSLGFFPKELQDMIAGSNRIHEKHSCPQKGNEIQ